MSVHNVDVIFIQLADAMELMLLSVLSPEVECEWGLSSSEEATITSVSKSTYTCAIEHTPFPEISATLVVANYICGCG